MNRRNRIFIGIVLAYLACVALLMWRLLTDIDPRYRESAEESLVETAHLMATLVEQKSSGITPESASLVPLFRALYAREFDADIFGLRKTRVDLRVTLVDAHGVVLFDSLGRGIGSNLSGWRDVRLALDGAYGARTTPDIADRPETSVMYVSAPIRVEGLIIGAVTVGKPVQSFGQFVDAARRKTLLAGITAALAAVVLTIMVSVWLVMPHEPLSDHVKRLRIQKWSTLPGYGINALRTGYQDVRDALAGRSYAADYVQTLTHELKSPLSSIRGAAELLQEPMPEADRRRFLGNIERETGRIQELVDQMMELAKLESRRRLEDATAVHLAPVLAELAASAAATGAPRGIQVRVAIAATAQEACVSGDAFLLRRAVGNLLDNALDFSPAGGAIVLGLQTVGRLAEITVHDAGPGVPDYAREKVFEKFFSLARPNSTRRSTGLGLPFVREVVQLHRGRVTLRNHEAGGAIATLTLPLLHSTAA